ncbi:MAG TPA: MarR family winged helix-turn-helix transcriptional regulator [Microbacterium sp.]|nr:MarR family winged helix-turn-helix transcriptional regulator [Microbacterium sp.]
MPRRHIEPPANPAAGVADRFLDAPLTEEVPFLTARARAVTNREANAALAEEGLNVRSYSVLALACSDARPSQRDLGGLLQLDASQVVGEVDQLQKNGFAIREVDPHDRRSKIIVPTALGREAHSRATALLAAATDRTLAPLTQIERDMLRALLRKVCFPDKSARQLDGSSLRPAAEGV